LFITVGILPITFYMRY